MPKELNNKNALVCGGSRGIGKAAAQGLAMAGANVTLVARSKALLENVVRALDTSSGQQHDWIIANFMEPEIVREKMLKLASEKTIHILINNTGGPPPGPVRSASGDAFIQAFHQHLICNHYISQALIPGMQDAAYGRIINVISTSVKQPIHGLGVSNTIRAAVANWSKTLSSELAPEGITVNNVLPGATQTERLAEIITSKAKKTGKTPGEVEAQMLAAIPMGRFATPEEISAAITFLASPGAAYITGTNIVVDGGRTGCL